MQNRYLCLYFAHLLTDWQTLRQPALKGVPLVFTQQERNRNIVVALNQAAGKEGVQKNMTAADAKAIATALEVIPAIPGKEKQLLKQIALWCLRYTPTVALDLPDGLILAISGCTHLWGSETAYLNDIINQLQLKGYHARAGIADTIAAAWGVARFGTPNMIVESGKQEEVLQSLPPQALKLTLPILEKLQKLGFTNIKSFMNLPASELRKRFDGELVLRLQQALGFADEFMKPIVAPVPYVFRISTLDAIKTATGIEIAIGELLDMLCGRLGSEGRGVRKAILKCYRVDGKMIQVGISTSQASSSRTHLMKLFKLQISQIEPKLGIELFVLEALKTEKQKQEQEQLWEGKPQLKDAALTELLDRVTVKVGAGCIKRYLPTTYYWPEQSIKVAQTLSETPQSQWMVSRPRPVRLLPQPAPIKVMALLPDYPPKQFLYKDKLHRVVKADGPERIEREWWRDKGQLRDYYIVEDEQGQRYWVFRSGHYDDTQTQWYLHGFFA